MKLCTYCGKRKGHTLMEIGISGYGHLLCGWCVRRFEKLGLLIRES